MKTMNIQDETIAFTAKTERTYDPDPAHSEHVTVLALALFDGLSVLHRYGPDERRLLAVAGRLHDIGWSQVQARSGKHHKLSGKIIQKLSIPGFKKRDIISCALVARYHTKALPNASRHKLFASLTAERRELIEWLAGILRIADALDRGHAKSINDLVCTVSRRAVKIHLMAAGDDCRAEVERAVQKQKLLIKKMAREIEYLC